MKRIVSVSILFFCLNLCLGQTGTTEKSTTKKTKAKIAKQNPQNNRTSQKTDQNTSYKNGQNPKETATANVSIDTLKIFNDSIHGLQNRIKALEAKTKQLAAERANAQDQAQELEEELNYYKTDHTKTFLDQIKIFAWTFVAIVLFGGVLYVLLRKLRRRNRTSLTKHVEQSGSKTTTLVHSTPPLPKKRSVVPPPAKEPVTNNNKSSNDERILKKSFSNINGKSNNWYIVGASSIGKTHITGNKPCQDNHYCEIIKNNAIIYYSHQ